MAKTLGPKRRRLLSSLLLMGLSTFGAVKADDGLPSDPVESASDASIDSDCDWFGGCDDPGCDACDCFGHAVSPFADTLGGDWFGVRSRLLSHGIRVDMSNTQYYQGVASGGLEQDFEYGGRNDYIFNVDGEKAGMWQGFFITLHGETRYADSANALTGALSPTNLMLALPKFNEDVTALTGVKFTQALSENFALFAGKINTLDDVKQPLTGASNTNGFMNASLIFNPIIARTIPYSTLGAGFAVLDNLQPVFSMAVFDTHESSTVSGFDTLFDNGMTLLTQLNVPTEFFGKPGHQGIYGTYSTGKYRSLDPTIYFDPIEGIVIAQERETDAWSLAYNFDQALWVSRCDQGKQWGVFGNAGIADDNPSIVNWFISGGISGTNPSRNRPADTFGLGFYHIGVSGELKDLAPVLLPLRDETGLEWYYNYAVNPWFNITPDLQIIEPFRERSEGSLIAGVRAQIRF